MPERGFETSFWTDRFVQKLPKDAKMLLAYLKTNEHCNQAGLYHITLETIAFETKIEVDAIPELFTYLKPTVIWYAEDDLVWVKDFIKEQTKSPKFIAAAAKCLTSITNNGVVHELLEYNLMKHSISIPYQYYMDKVSILTRASVSSADASASAVSKEVGVVKGKEDKGRPRKLSNNPLIAKMQEFLGYPGSIATDPVPNPAKEAKFLSKMLTRGFSEEEIFACWERKVKERGEFVSMQWVNDDIGQKGGKTSGTGSVRPKPEQSRVKPIKRIPGDEPTEN